MIEARELRIGNKLLAGTGIITVSELYADEFKTPEEGFVCYDHEQVAGIPLTDEWFKRFGFGKIISWVIEILPDTKLEIAHNNDNSELQYYCYLRQENKTVDDDYVLIRKDLKHVHQLQNLYFALTGKELEYKGEKE